jgi:hypothetical protein
MKPEGRISDLLSFSLDDVDKIIIRCLYRLNGHWNDLMMEKILH